MNLHTKELHNQGVSIWLDNITRKILDNGTLENYIATLSVTGLTSNPTIFDNAIAQSNDYDQAIRELDNKLSDEDLFFKLAIVDIQRAADLFLPTYQRSNGLDGFVSIEVSPLLAYDTEKTIKAAKDIFQKVSRPNVFIKIPGTPEGLPAIEMAIAEGIPINITLLFSANQYVAAANAYLNGIETRVKKGLKADVRSVASVFVSRWDKAISGTVSEGLQNKLGLAVSGKTYQAYVGFLASARVQKLMNFGVLPQRLLWASTGAKDPRVSDIIYVKDLAAPFTVNTIPENTLLAFADHGETGEILSTSGTDADEILQQFEAEGVDIEQLADQLQQEGAQSFNASWEHLIQSIHTKRKQI